MRLLYIHQYFKFPDNSGGTRSYDLATSFHNRGVDVSVLTSETDPEDISKRWNEFERDGIKFYVLNCPYNNLMGFRERISSFLKFLWFASIKSLEIKCDIVLATSTPLTIAVPALIKKLFNKTPYIFEVRDVWPDIPIKMGFIKNKLAIKILYCFERLVYKYSISIVPLSVGMEKNIMSRFPNNKMTIIPNISELSRFDNIGKPIELPFDTKGKKIVLYAGTFGNVNGLEYLVDLAEKTLSIDNSIIYLLYGKGAKLEKVLDIARERGILEKNFFYGGVVAKSALPYLYSICTVGCSTVIDNPILWDNSANKFFDTLAARCPIVINHKGWQADVIAKENVGYVLPPIMDNSSAGLFVKYLKNSKLIKLQGENARELATKEYCLEIAVDRYMRLLTLIDAK